MGNTNQILAVDDSRDTLDLITHILKADGFQVRSEEDSTQVATDLPKALNNIAAVILDWNMPGLDGIALLKKIKQNPNYRHLPVIMLTAHDSEEHIRTGIENGAFYYLTKPVENDLLKTIVSSAVRATERYLSLNEEITEAQAPFGFLQEATFKVKTFFEGRQLARSLGSICVDPNIAALALDELITNAIEHGNLEIDLDHKTKLLQKGNYSKVLNELFTKAPFKDRMVTIKLKRKSQQLEMVIIDQGPGFDFVKFESIAANAVFKPNGRGIMLVRSANFSHFEYIQPGNQVRLTLEVAGSGPLVIN